MNGEPMAGTGDRRADDQGRGDRRKGDRRARDRGAGAPLARPTPFPSLAYLFRPSDPDIETAIVEPDERWAPPGGPRNEVDVLIWGRLALNRRPSARSIEYASRREIAVQRLRARPPAGFRLVELHRLPPVRRPGAIRRRVRKVSLGGIVAELIRDGAPWTERPPRVIDAVVFAAGSDAEGPRIRPSGDGSALARLTLTDGTRAELRVAQAGHPKDPARGHGALTALADAGVDLVPRPLGGGVTAGAAWSTETVAPGRHVHALTTSLLTEVTAFLATMPAGASDLAAIDEQLAAVADFFPEHATALSDIAAAAARWATGLRPVLMHGDLWVHNMFTTDGRLSAVFDWDTWHPSGLPGTDLLNLPPRMHGHAAARMSGQLLCVDYWRRPRWSRRSRTLRGAGRAPPDQVAWRRSPRAGGQAGWRARSTAACE